MSQGAAEKMWEISPMVMNKEEGHTHIKGGQDQGGRYIFISHYSTLETEN